LARRRTARSGRLIPTVSASRMPTEPGVAGRQRRVSKPTSACAWRRAWLAGVLLGVGLAAGCGGGSAAAGVASCPNDTPAACPAKPPSFASDVGPVLESRCGGACHSPTGVEPSRPIQTWAEVSPQAQSILSQVHACRMPPIGEPPLLASERQLILAWLVCGAPDN